MYLCSVLYVLLQLWLLCVCLQVCVGPVCEEHDSDVPRTGMYTWILQIRQLDGLPSTRRWAVEVYFGPSSGSTSSVRIYITCT